MEQSPEADEFVTPYILCDICKEIFEAFTKKELWDDVSQNASDDEQAEYPSWVHIPPLDKPLRFHDTLAQLRQSADDGCHLCSLFIGPDLRNKNRVARVSLRLTGERGSLNKKCQTIRFTIVEEGMSEHSCPIGSESLYDDLGTVALHRHVCDGTVNQCIAERKGPDPRYQRCKTTRSPMGFKMLGAWLQHCINQHKDCSLKLNSTKPTRLLDLNVFQRPEAFAWYSPRKPKKKGNYENLRSQIELVELPRTIKDAIEVCRGLHTRYLWVDALCIKQESGEDFSHEVANMGSIYANSLFTIAATDTTEADSTFFRERNPLCKESCVLIGSDEIHWVFERHSFQCLRGHSITQRTRLSERGWALQEYMLSPRTIHFTSHEIVWECREQRFCRVCRGREIINPHERFGGKNAISKMIGNVKELGQEFLLEMWEQVLSMYSSTELTNSDDRLSALAGVAQLIEDRLHYKSSYGLWLESFVEQLLWCSLSIEVGDDAVPSWSWLSTRGIWYRGRNSKPEHELRHARVSRYPTATSFRQISALHKQISQPVSFTVCGWIKSFHVGFGSVVWSLIPASEELPAVMGALIQGNRDAYLSEDMAKLEQAGDIDQTRVSSIYCLPDAPLVRREELFCLLLKRIFYGNVIDYGLVLQRINPEKAVYKRVGYFDEYISSGRIRKHQQRMKDFPKSLSESTAETASSGHTNAEPSITDDVAAETLAGGLTERNPPINGGPKSGVRDDGVTPSTSGHTASQEDSEDSEPEMGWQEMVKYLRLFNGTETEAEIEII